MDRYKVQLDIKEHGGGMSILISVCENCKLRKEWKVKRRARKGIYQANCEVERNKFSVVGEGIRNMRSLRLQRELSNLILVSSA